MRKQLPIMMLGTAFLISGVLGSYAMAEVSNVAQKIEPTTATPKQFEDPMFKKPELKQPTVNPKKFDDPLWKKKELKQPTVSPTQFEDPVFKKKELKDPVVNPQKD